MATRLEEIMQSHRDMASKDERDPKELLQSTLETPKPRDLRAALRVPGLSLITEVKRRSPSAGDLNLELDPAKVAADYEKGGSAALSVLTDEKYFGGSVADFKAARGAVKIPALRKDFTVDERDVIDARRMGADGVLLIVAGLSDDELFRFGAVAQRLSLTALFEVHDEAEIKRAISAGASVIGVNQRNLHTFEIDPELAISLGSKLPVDVVKVAESGIKTADDIARLASAGFNAALVGTSLVTAGETRDAVAALVAAGSL